MLHLLRASPRASCTSPVQTKQSCLFHNVCLVFGGLEGQTNSITAVQLGGSLARNLGSEQLSVRLSSVLGSIGGVKVFTYEAAATAKTFPESKPSSAAATLLNLWDGNVCTLHQQRANCTVLMHSTDDSSSVHAPTGTTVLFEDTLTVMAAPGKNEVSVHDIYMCAWGYVTMH